MTPGFEVAIFDAASGIEDPAERRDFIDWVFRDFPEEAQRMNTILGSESAARSWLQRAENSLADLTTEIQGARSLQLQDHLLESAELDDLSQSVAPRYTILHPIGGGSGGQVYLVEQLQPVQRKVAIKLLRSGLETPVFIAAFQREQQILAAMNHPGIAAILDAGITHSGRPYLVMEYIEGARITDYCDTRHLTIRQRLDLFLEVCSAVQHAHQKGIIHRDLKPSNILITHADSRPLPKVIDFGIASAGEGRGDLQQVTGTPGYMSPEQATPGSDVDTLSDVFSLGVVFYELLAGQVPWAPHRLLRAAPAASSRLSCLPSKTLTAIAGFRQLGPRDLIARLRGDLDAIIAKAINLDRRQRYDTVEALASDIIRHKRRYPIKARSASRRYIASCFLVRNRLACLAGAAVILAVSLGAVISVNYFFLERRALKESEANRAKTAALLAQASARENITRAAILLEQNQFEAADAVLRQSPLSKIEPSTEAAYVFRFLGERNALLGRWKEASECYSRLMMANRFVPIEQVAKGNDFLFGMPVMLEAGDIASYKALREDLFARLPKTNDSLVAERMVKSCLLIPPPSGMLGPLRPMADRLRINGFNEWFAFDTALFDFRDGRFQSAREIAARSAPKIKNPPCRIGMVIIGAMSAHELGDTDAARRDLIEASTMIEKSTARVIVEDYRAYDSSQGSWAAWAIARILHREATSCIGR